MIQFEEIIPVSLFKQSTKEHLYRLGVSDKPILLTIHGRGAFVMQHVSSYATLASLAEVARHGRVVEDMLRRMEVEGHLVPRGSRCRESEANCAEAGGSGPF